MRFVIVGYGRVGARTARILGEESHDVVVVERDEGRADRAADDGFEVVRGDGSNEAVLERAGVDEADAIAGLTGDVNANFAACMLGKEHGCRTVMRIDADYRSEIYERYANGVDEIIYPERLGAASAKTALLGGNLNAVGDLVEGLQVTVVSVPAGAPAVGRKVNELDLPSNARLYAHGRDREPLGIPMPGAVVEAGDRLALLVALEAVDDVEARLLG